ncbi:MAG TPA: ribose-5-phosphate isomerase RpiA [Paracoccaceae bacterium]|nr:ribose-5-phosphate isomerase RpiA [Paracoccaceae bacterium]
MAAELDRSEIAKRAAARAALKEVEDGMRLGLGTGSTAAWFVRLLGERAKRDRLDVTCVPTSVRTARLAEKAGLRLTTLDEAGWLDLTVDGADEFDPDLDLIKGGGGALLQEKIVATASDRMIVIADPSKRVQTLGAFPLPVEIVTFGWETTKAIVEETLEDLDVGGRLTTLRLDRDEPFLTDCGNFIIDLHLKRIGDAEETAAALNMIAGVVETGLFVGVADTVIVGHGDDRAEVLTLDEEDEDD